MPKEDYCYECRSIGDDYMLDENGEMISSCEQCWITEQEDCEDDD